LQILITDANVEVDIKAENADLPSAKTEGPTKSFELKMRGMENKQRISVNTSALENKINAFKHILMLAEAMGTGFQQYSTLVMPVITKHISHFSRAIRKRALKTFQYLLVAEGEPNNLKVFKDIYNQLGMHVFMANKKDNVKDLKLIFKEMFHCMRVISQNTSPENQRFFENEN
jgi:hypothetical protein